MVLKNHFRSNLACEIALKATSTVLLEENGRREIDIKRYAKVEKVNTQVDRNEGQPQHLEFSFDNGIFNPIFIWILWFYVL